VSQNPRRVLSDVMVYWPPSNTMFPIYVRKGSVIDIPPGSQLETAYGGPGNLQAVTADLGSATTLDKSFLGN
jgi:hypothetical protein